MKSFHILVFTFLLMGGRFLFAQAGPLAKANYSPADPDLKVVSIDSDPRESFLSVRADTMGRLFVGGRESLFVYEPNDRGGYHARKLLYKFPDHSWVYDIEIRGNDLYVLTLSALYLIPDGVVRRENVQPRRLIWGVPKGHVHQCFHALAWGPEGDLYLSMGDPLWYYGDFERPDHWGHWTFYVPGDRISYTGVGGVFRCKPDGRGFQVVAGGLRNPCGLCFDRHWNLFTNDNDHEGMPALYVPGKLVHVTPQADFSWPRGWMASKTPERADLLETMYDGLGRAVPVGQAYYHETFLPEKYRNNLLLARWGTRSITRYPLQPRGASFKVTGEHALLVGQNQARPVGVSVGRGGRIFAAIAHMAHNENSPIYQSDLVMITRADDPPAHPFEPYDAVEAKEEKLWSELNDPSWSRRLRAHGEILRRGGKLLEEAGKRLLQARVEEPAFHHLIWLTAKSERGHLILNTLTKHPDPLARVQSLRALGEFPEQRLGFPIFAGPILDDHPQVQHAALLAFFHPGVEFLPAVKKALMHEPARSQDTYLRQTATLLLARRGTLEDMEGLCAEKDPRHRLAGVLAAGFRLTLPAATEPLAKDLPLAPFRSEEAYVIEFADRKVDLRELGRLGCFTLADHWKAGKHTKEQERLFGLLRKMLQDPSEPVQLQAAHFLSLLNDSRSEPEIARVRQASVERKLATAPIKVINEVWLIGPFPDDRKGLMTIHPPERSAIDLTETFSIPLPKGEKGQERKNRQLNWQAVRPKVRYDLRKLSGPCDDSSFYAYTRLESAHREKAILMVGSDDGVKVWLNGRAIWKNEVVRAALPYQDVVVLDLQPGSNDLLVRVHNIADDCALYLHLRSLGEVAIRLPEKLSGAALAERLKAGAGKEVAREFLDVDWSQAVKEGDAVKGRQLFAALACSKCHAVTHDAAVVGGPSLADARKRFTLSYLVESILLPDKQISPLFKATQVETKSGKVLTGLAVKETADKLEIVLPDASRHILAAGEIVQKKLLDQSPMPAGLVRTPLELRDLLAYLLSDQPQPP